MIIYPAIDLKDGKCVRLFQGDFDAATIYNPDPGDQAERFAAAGADYVHCIDLDGAATGKPVNVAAVKNILGKGLKLQLGGGVRDMATIDHWFDHGVERIILGTAALKDPQLVRRAASAYPGRVVVGADARDGMIAAEGWLEMSSMPVLDLVRRFEDCGVAAVIFTDIGRDGALSGVNKEATLALADSVSMPVIASGGVASIEDITNLSGSAIAGIIIGRALYDGRIDLADAIAMEKDV